MRSGSQVRKLHGMIKVFYVGGSASSNGILRAVLPDMHASNLAATQQFTYLGSTFPQQAVGSAPATILEVSADHTETTWQPGFYRAERPPLQFDETLRSLNC